MPHTLTLSQKQRLFCSLIAQLITWLYAKGYECTFGEAYRSDEQAEINAIGTSGRAAVSSLLRTRRDGYFDLLADKIDNNTGSGIRTSVHMSRIAVDLNLFKNGIYLTRTEDYKIVGEKWENMHILARWGGRFGDGNHFSLEHDGKK